MDVLSDRGSIPLVSTIYTKNPAWFQVGFFVPNHSNFKYFMRLGVYTISFLFVLIFEIHTGKPTK